MFNVYNLAINLLFGAGAGSGTGTPSSTSRYGSIILMVAMFAGMYFLMIRPQKKKQKEEQEMRETIQIGDEITTIGGIIGRIVTVKEESLVIETGADRTKLTITRWAIQTNNTSNERLDAERKAAEDERNAQKEQAAIDAAVSDKPTKKRKKVLNKKTEESNIENINQALEEEKGSTSIEDVEKNND